MIKNSITTKYTCAYCHKVYVKESAYMEHQCTQMKREAELKTPNGQTAWNYYQLWMRLKKRVPPSASTFITSKYFRTFVNFVEFSKKMKLPLPEKFIWFAVQKDYQPTLWTNDEIYSLYMDFVDATIDPIELVNLSIKTLFDYADSRDIDVSEVFDIMPTNELLQLIRVRKVSPWLLLSSKKFAKVIQTLTSEQQQILETLIRPDFWSTKLTNNPPVKKDKIKQYVAELGI